MNPLYVFSLRVSISCCLLVGLILLFGCAANTPSTSKREQVGGVVVEAADDSYQGKLKLQEEITRRQEMELDKQDREIEDLKRQQYHNKVFRQYGHTPR